MTLASELKLEELVGKKVRATREFSGVPKGMTGTVVKRYSIGPRHEGVDVAWDRPLANWTSRPLIDGFGRDKDFDETKWLELVE